MNKYLAEAVGTFALVFAGTGAVVVNDVSGAHLNPAVTCGFWIARRLPGKTVLPYVAGQVVGGLAASGLLRLMFQDHATLGATRPAGPVAQSFALEAVLTFILMFVILSVSVGPKEKGVMAGIAVGGVIAFEAMFGGPVSGASMNPARSLAPALVSGNLKHLWLYLVAPVLGAAAAVACWRAVYGEKCYADQRERLS